MGIWDAGFFAVDTLKQRLPDSEPVKNAGRAAAGAAYSVANKFARGAPDLITPITGILRGSYGHGRAVASTVDQAVRVDGMQRIKESLPDKECCVRIAWNLTDLALDKYSRLYTGGLPVYRTMMERVKKDRKVGQDIKEEELLEMRLRMERLEALLLEQRSSPAAYPLRRMVGSYQNPEDVIRVFMMKGFTGGNFVHDQVDLQHGNWKRDV